VRHCDEKFQVELFLTLVRDLLIDNLIAILSRPKNIQAMIDHELTYLDQVAMIEGLTAADYRHTLPAAEADESSAHVFGVVRRGVTFYIKLKIKPHPSDRGALHCVSFHEAEEDLEHPYEA
jgi:hypothetical protein